MVDQFINAESLLFSRKLIGLRNPPMGASIAYFFGFEPESKNTWWPSLRAVQKNHETLPHLGTECSGNPLGT